MGKVSVEATKIEIRVDRRKNDRKFPVIRVDLAFTVRVYAKYTSLSANRNVRQALFALKGVFNKIKPFRTKIPKLQVKNLILKG